MKPGLCCDGCKLPLTIDEIMRVAHMAPSHGLHFHCPRCGVYASLEISHSTFAVGMLDGFPGPNFITTSSIGISSFKAIRTGPRTSRFEVDGKEWAFESESPDIAWSNDTKEQP